MVRVCVSVLGECVVCVCDRLHVWLMTVYECVSVYECVLCECVPVCVVCARVCFA